MLDGISEGWPLGWPDGMSEGFPLGWPDGQEEGAVVMLVALLGCDDGLPKTEGCSDGCPLGMLDEEDFNDGREFLPPKK